MPRLGTIQANIYLLGTNLQLYKGQRVVLEPATNLPEHSPVKWYARPLPGECSDYWGEDSSFPIDNFDVEVDDDAIEFDELGRGV